MPLKFWWNAFQTATYLINRLPTPTLNNKSPFELLFHKKPNYSVIKVFGCVCFPYLRPYNHHKLEFRASRCIFLGYSSNHKGYLCLHSSRRIYISNHVIFNESCFPYEPRVDFSSVHSSCPSSCSSSHLSSSPSSQSIVSHIVQLDTSSFQSPPAVAPLLSQSSHVISNLFLKNPSPATSQSTEPTSSHVHNMSPPQQPAPGHHMIIISKAGIFKPKLYIANCLAKPTEPSTVSEAMLDPKWHKAMTEEYKALMDNQTWVLFKPSHPVRVIGSK